MGTESSGSESPTQTKDTLEVLERRVGYSFQDRAVLVQALTHRSYANERGKTAADNEVLEFLGDAVLGLVVSDALCGRFPFFTEGQMSKLKSFLVSADTLSKLADALGVGEFILLGRGEEKTAGRAKKSILANTLEAVIAAIYTDGGLEPAREFILRQVAPLVDDVDEVRPHPVHDFKSAVQEHVQASGLALPEYEVVDESGPDHEKLFHVELAVDGSPATRGVGPTKKRAEQDAARRWLETPSPETSSSEPDAETD